MKNAVLSLMTLALAQFSNADVCQIKPRMDREAGDVRMNIYSLVKGSHVYGNYSFYEIDFQYAVSERDSLIEKGLCEKEPVLEACSIRIEPTKPNPVEVYIGENLLTVYGGLSGVDQYSLDIASKTINMLKAAKACK